MSTHTVRVVETVQYDIRVRATDPDAAEEAVENMDAGERCQNAKNVTGPKTVCQAVRYPRDEE